MSIIAKEYDEIKIELQQYSFKTIGEFKELFPIKTGFSIIINVYPKEFFNFSLDTYNVFTKSAYSHIPIHIKNVADFWEKWNRFKKLKAFL